MRLTIVRHGETHDNVNRIIQGQTHGKLTPAGEEQTRKAALALKDVRFDAAYVSDLKRTMRTADILLAHHPDTPVHPAAELREIHLGEHEGKPVEHLRAARTAKGVSRWDYTPEGGEGMRDCQKRMTEFYRTLLARHGNDENILLVSHGTAIATLLHDIEGIEFDDATYNKYHPGNTAITIIDVDVDGKHNIHTLNSMEHL
ncbi:MAG: histidine phosphatase family protein [Nanoarchaeota archaeon]